MLYFRIFLNRDFFMLETAHACSGSGRRSVNTHFAELRGKFKINSVKMCQQSVSYELFIITKNKILDQRKNYRNDLKLQEQINRVL